MIPGNISFFVGKIIVTGCKSEADVTLAAQKFVKILEKVGYPVSIQDFDRYQFKIQNMTATCDFGFPIGLEALIFSQSSFATYEPELFPGLVYRMQNPKVVLLVFVSGKVVLTGAKSQDDLCSGKTLYFFSLYTYVLCTVSNLFKCVAYENIDPILTSCRRKHVLPAK
jgi:TATA-box binding protein (TBP) (component of TFIID and TFIIIB)